MTIRWNVSARRWELIKTFMVASGRTLVRVIAYWHNGSQRITNLNVSCERGSWWDRPSQEWLHKVTS